MDRIRARFLLCAALTALLLVGCATGAASQSGTAARKTETPNEEPASEPVLLGGQSYSGNETMLKLVLTADEIPLLERFASLTALDLSGSDCYAEIEAYREAHPAVDVRYTVRIDGREIPNDAAALTVSAPVDPALLSCLPGLKTLTVTEPVSPDEAGSLLAARRDAELFYSVSFCGRTVANTERELDLSAASPERLDEICAALAVLPNVSRVRLDPANGASAWTLEQADALQRIREDLLVDYTATVFNTRFCLTDESVVFRDIDLLDRTDEVRDVLSRMPHVGRVIFDRCGIPDEQMAALRSEFSAPKVVWRVFLRDYSCYTDAVMIRFSEKRRDMQLTDMDTLPLTYCNEVKYLDLGHNCFTDAYFVGSMPDLEVLILAVGDTTDISALKNCPKLEYCELFTCHVSDISVLANCANLEHLNLSRSEITDITPLYGLKKLKRLWLSYTDIPQEQIDTIRTLLKDCEVDVTASHPTANGWRFLGDDPRCCAPRYRLLREQMRYADPEITSY